MLFKNIWIFILFLMMMMMMMTIPTFGFKKKTPKKHHGGSGGGNKKPPKKHHGGSGGGNTGTNICTTTPTPTSSSSPQLLTSSTYQTCSKVPFLQSTDSPKGIFIPVTIIYYNYAGTWVYLDSWLTNTCKNSAKLPPDQRMTDLVLHDLAIENKPDTCNNGKNYTILWNVLDIISPYFPGGTKSCFTNLFIGTIDLPRFRPYMGGDPVLDPEYRKKYIEYSYQIGQEFKNKFPSINFNWYITHRQNFNNFRARGYFPAYMDFFPNLINNLTSIQSTKYVMWKPNFLKAYATSLVPAKYNTNIKNMFTKIQTDAPPGINWVNFEDNSDKSNCANCGGGKVGTETDAISWYNWLKSLDVFPTLQICELLNEFSYNCVAGARNATDQVNVENIYGMAGIPLGATYSIQFWRGRFEQC